MVRKNLIIIHVTATIIAFITIFLFFTSSLISELYGNEIIIRLVKKGILYTIPILFIAMPTLALSGKKLAGNSISPIVLLKLKRMKVVVANGILLTSLAIFLYYQAYYRSINSTFYMAQAAELVFGFFNMVLIGLNIRSGRRLSR